MATKMFDESVGYCPVFDTLEELEEAYPDSTYLKISVDEERQKCSEEQV